MIFLDSWVWLEYVFEGDRWRAAEAAIDEANSTDGGGIVAATAIAEIAHRIHRQADADTASEAVDAIRELEHVEVLPVTGEITERAAALRDKYYRRGDRELSYADAIHLAMADAVSGCDTLYSGDPDFEGVDEIDTVVL